MTGWKHGGECTTPGRTPTRNCANWRSGRSRRIFSRVGQADERVGLRGLVAGFSAVTTRVRSTHRACTTTMVIQRLRKDLMCDAGTTRQTLSVVSPAPREIGLSVCSLTLIRLGLPRLPSGHPGPPLITARRRSGRTEPSRRPRTRQANHGKLRPVRACDSRLGPANLRAGARPPLVRRAGGGVADLSGRRRNAGGPPVSSSTAPSTAYVVVLVLSSLNRTWTAFRRRTGRSNRCRLALLALEGVGLLPPRVPPGLKKKLT